MKFLKDIIKILKSRTLLTLLLMFAFNIMDVAGAKIDPTISMAINALLTALAGYFRINAKQSYKTEIIKKSSKK